MTIKHSDNFDLSLALGEKAIDQLKQDTVPAWPEMYEVLYSYIGGRHEEVIAAVDAIRSRNNGSLSSDELIEIYDEFFSCDRTLAVSDEVSTKIGEEIRKILIAMKAATNQTEKYDLALTQIEAKCTEIKTPEQLHSVIKILSDVTSSIAQSNRNLNDRLQQSAQQIDILHQDLEKARNESNTDALTGLANRKKFDRSLRRAFKDFKENGGKLSLLLADIDHFKSFNDRYGHQTGDQVLRLVSHTLKTSIKGRDTAARYGGEEFAIILPETSGEDAFKVAEHIREAIMAKELIKRSTGENLGRITVSIGVAEALPDEIIPDLIERSDKALYVAKDTGRNLCVMAPTGQNETLANIA